MTHEEFNAKFQLLNQVTEGSVRTYHAMASSGAVVMAHFLEGGAADGGHPILTHLEALDPERKSRVLKITQVDGSPVVVTRFILDFTSLQQWLGVDEEAMSDPEASAVAPEPEPLPPALPDPAAEPPLPEAPAPEPMPWETVAHAEAAAPSPPEPPVSPAAEVKSEPGEFTLMFQAARPVPEASAAPKPPPAAEPPIPTEPPTPAVSPAPEPDELEAAIFGTREPEPAPEPAPEPEPQPEPSPRAAEPAPPPPPAENTGPGEFTRMFQVPMGAAGQPVPAPPAPAPAPEPPAELEAPPVAADPVPPPAAAPPEPAPTEAAHEPEPMPWETAAHAEAAVPSPPEPPASPAAEKPSEPGEFTQLFQAGRPPAPVGDAQPAPRAVPEPPEARPPAPQAPPAAAPQAPQSDGPGEFTRMFQAPTLPEQTAGSAFPSPARDPSGPPAPQPPMDAPRAAPPPPPHADDLADAAAELRLPERRRVDLPSASPSLPGLNLNPPQPLSPQSGAPSAGPEAGARPQPNPGEFTAIFGQVGPSGSLGPMGSPRSPSMPSGQGAAPASNSLNLGSQGKDGYAGRLQSPGGDAPPHGAPMGMPPAATNAAQPRAEMGEYTRIMAAQAAPPPQAPPAAAPPQPRQQPQAAPEPAGSSMMQWLLIAGLVLVLGIAVALVLYFVLRTPAA